MSSEDGYALVRWWVEFWGRRKQAPPPSFQRDIITAPAKFKTGWFDANYLYLFPDTAAVITSPEGKRDVVTRAGYVSKAYGIYSLQYIDLKKNQSTLPSVRGESKDGLPVSLSVNLTWQVTPNNPSIVMESNQPLSIFLTACTTAVRSFIRSHKHDELVLGQDGVRVEDVEISRYILQEIGQNRDCRGFTIISVRITDRQGDPKLVEIQQGRIVQEKSTLSEKEKLQQQKELADQREKLVRQQANLAKIQATFDAERAKILQAIKVLEADADRLRKLPEWQHEEALKGLEVREKAIEMLIQAQGIQGFPRSLDEAQMLDGILKSLPEPTGSTSTSLALLSSSLSSLMSSEKSE